MPSYFKHLLLTLTLSSLGFGAGQQEPFNIVDNVDLVLLDVSVRNPTSASVLDLPRNAFQLKVDGKPQPISHFSRVDAPVTIGLIVDNSGSMRRKRDHVIMAGLAFARESNPQDEFFTVNFNDTVRAGLPVDVPFTDRIDLLHNAMYMGASQGRTALYDAIAFGLKHLESGHRDQRTLIVVSDGGDNVSQLHQRDIFELVQESRATVYSIGLLDPDENDLRPSFLKKLALITGGEYLQPGNLEEISAALNQISKDIRSRYSLGFAPPSDARQGQLHRIKVTAEDQDGHKLLVRTRTSYISNLPTNNRDIQLQDWR